MPNVKKLKEKIDSMKSAAKAKAAPPKPKLTNPLTHDAFMKFSAADKLKVSDVCLKILMDIAGMPLAERAAYFAKNEKQLKVNNFSPPSQNDDMIALYAFYGCDEAIRCSKGKAKTEVLKKLDRIAKACIDAYNLNSKVPGIPQIHYNDLLDIAKRCIELVEENE
jgi:hypothetical protein